MGAPRAMPIALSPGHRALMGRQFSVAQQIRFGPYAADLRSGELYKSDIKPKLREQSFQVLTMLLEHPGEVVSREQLRQRLWPQETFVDFDHGLNAAVERLRRCLNDSAACPTFIETLPRRGYRFIGKLDCVEADVPVQIPNEGLDATGQHRRRTIFLVSTGVLATLLLLFFLGARGWKRLPGATKQFPHRTMLAVLPFQNLSGDASQDYFSDGLTEEMITQLGRLDPKQLGVIARTSVMHYKNTQQPLDQIGRELGVQYVLEGSVRRESDKVRITAQLIQIKDQTHLWAREYDRETIHLLPLQSEIAQEVAGGIQLTLRDQSRTESTAKTSAPKTYEAYDLYLKGQYFWNRRTPQDFRQAIDYFQQAAAKEPGYARAYAGLANSYALMGGYTGEPQAEFISKARSAALRALELGIGDKDEAFAWLEKAYSQHSNVLTSLKVDPIYDPLRSDPHFQDLLHRVGLAAQ